MTRTAARRAAGLLSLVLATGVGASACTSEKPPGPTVDKLADGLQRLDLTGVPLDGTDGATATSQLKALTAELGAPQVSHDQRMTEQGEDAGTVPLALTWRSAPGWTARTAARLVRRDGAWKVAWRPDSVVPGAAAGDTVDVTRTTAARGRILGAGGTPLVEPRPVIRVGVDKAQATPEQALAAAPKVAAFAGLSDPAAYAARVEAAGPKAFVEAIVLRRDDPQAKGIDALVGGTPGAGVVDAELPLAPTRTFARSILGSVGEATAEIVQGSDGAIQAGDVVGTGGLQRSQDQRLRGTPGVTVTLTHQGTPTQLHRQDPVAGRDVSTTLDVAAQTKAEAVLAEVGPASALVALRPSTGDVLAAASGPGSTGTSTATLGAYAPGSTFKVVSALALLRSGVAPASPVPCTATVTVDGKPFENYDAYPADGLGQVPFSTAFARSCNTAFIAQRDRAGTGQLAEAAEALGLTATPGLGVPGYLGKVPEATSEVDHAAQMIGQSEITASPLGMATVVASVLAGRAVRPRLVIPEGSDGGTSAAAPVTGTTSPGGMVAPAATSQAVPTHPLTADEAQQLRGLMRGVVTGGSGELLSGLPGEVVAKTGTAEFGTTTPPKKHAWMVAGRGDLAVAVFVDEGEGGSRTAGPILKAYLEGMP